MYTGAGHPGLRGRVVTVLLAVLLWPVSVASASQQAVIDSIIVLDEQAKAALDEIMTRHATDPTDASVSEGVAMVRALWMEAADMAASSANDSIRAKMLLKVASTHEFEGAKDTARSLYGQTVDLGLQSGNPEAAARALNSLAGLRAQENEVREAIVLRDSALVLLEQADLPEIEFYIHEDLGDDYRRLGEFGTATTHYEAALALPEIEEVGAGERAGVLFGIGRVHSALELYDDARVYLDSAVALYETAGPDYSRARAAAWWGRTDAAIGQASQGIDRALTSDDCITRYEAIDGVDELIRSLERWNERELDVMLSSLEGLLIESVGAEQARDIVQARREQMTQFGPSLSPQLEELRGLIAEDCANQ